MYYVSINSLIEQKVTSLCLPTSAVLSNIHTEIFTEVTGHLGIFHRIPDKRTLHVCTSFQTTPLEECSACYIIKINLQTQLY